MDKVRVAGTQRGRELTVAAPDVDDESTLRTTMADITAELELSTLLQAIVERAVGLLEATEGELVLPPGLTSRMIPNAAVSQ